MGEYDENCIFCKIANKLEKAYIIWEDDIHIAFLSIFPNTPGVTVVIPKAHHPSYAFDLDAKNLIGLTLASQKVARYLDENLLDTMRTAMVFEGFGVNHVHAKLFPMHGPKLQEWKPIKSNIKTKFNSYQGYISSHDAERATDNELREIQQTLTKKLHEKLRLKVLCIEDARKCVDVLRQNKISFGDGFKLDDLCESEAHAKKFIEDALVAYNHKKSVTFGIWSGEKLAGIIALRDCNWTNRSSEVSYCLAKSFTGRGIMTAACKSILNYGFINFELNTIFINVNESNVKGSAVPQRLMFDSSRKYEQNLNGVVSNFLEFTMNSSNWRRLQDDASYRMVPAITFETTSDTANSSFKSCFTSAYRVFSCNRFGFSALIEATGLARVMPKCVRERRKY